jgi:SAM-dependent methyltransferase
MPESQYMLRGGVEGRERLRVMARVLRPSTLALFERAGIRPGMACLDVGCGGGDVSLDLARLVGKEGHVVGIDRDEIKIALAREEAAAAGGSNVEFRVGDILGDDLTAEFDLVFVRFVLTHLADPDAAVRKFSSMLRPGGLLLTVDIDFHGYFTYPENAAFQRYYDLYIQLSEKHGGDPYIGPRLPGLLHRNGFERVQMNLMQLAALEGEMKLLTPLTMENIADSLVAENLVSREEVQSLTGELYKFAHAADTVGSTPRFIEAWGSKREN